MMLLLQSIQLTAQLSKDHHYTKPKHNQKKQNLCLDKAYHSKEVNKKLSKRGYIPHIRHRREEERIIHRKHPAARRWVVERTNSWHNRLGNYLQGMKRKMKTIFVLSISK